MIAGGWPRGRATVALGAALAAVALSSAAAQAQTSFGIASFGVSASSQQAEAHTDFHTQFMLDTNARGGPRGQLRDVRVRLPAGITGGSSLVPRCSPTEFELLSCQPPAQVGVMTIFYKLSSEPSEQVEQVTVPLYNLAPVSGSSATFGTSLLATKILIEAELSKDGTYALEVVIQDLSNEIPVVGTSLTLWGVPASSTHDLERSRTESGGPQLIYGPPNEFEEREVIGIEPTPAGVAPTPLLTSSSDCEGPPLTSTLLVESWEGQSDRATSPMPAPTGCELLRIAPSISIAPETTKRDTPSGYDIDIGYPIDEEPFELATPSLRSVALTLPLGTSLSLGVANGLVGCTETQFQAGECPGASKLGTATIDTPLLAKPLEGAIYLSAPTPEAMYRMLVTATGEGVTVRLIGVMHADPETGQLTVVFTENPQLPFSALDLHLFGGERAPLSNPATCGEASTTARFVSYGGQTASAASTFHIDANGFGGACPSPAQFTPSFIAGTLSPAAGSFSPFTLTVAREDGQQTLGGIAANLPPGLMGVLGTVPTCGEAAASLGGCPQSSLIGSAAIGVGAGASPLPLTGSVYLTGPYKGAPFGLAIVVPAIAGPFDLGTIVVRAQVKVTSRRSAPCDRHRSAAADSLRHPAASAHDKPRSEQAGLHRKSHQLLPDVGWGGDRVGAGGKLLHLLPIPGERLSSAAVCAQAGGCHACAGQQPRQRRWPQRADRRCHEWACEPRVGDHKSAQAAQGAADDGPAVVPGGDVREEPGSLPSGIGGGQCGDPHAGVEHAADRARVPRVLPRHQVPEAGDGFAGQRRGNSAVGVARHQQRDQPHRVDVIAGHPDELVRNEPARGRPFAAGLDYRPL